MTIRAGGIKVSPPLAQFDLVRGNSAPPDHGLVSLLAGLADERINLTFLTRAGSTAPTVASFCVTETDRARAEDVVRALPDIASRLSMIAPVVAVSVYPHGADAGLLGALLRTLAINNVPLLGLATSLSVLTVTVGASRLEPALAALDDILELPPNHAPLRWEPTERRS